MKYVEYKCPNCGGSIKYEKGMTIGTCENCGAMLSVEADITDKLFRAYDLINQKRFTGAKDLLNECVTEEVKNGQVYLGLLLCDTECATPSELATTKYKFANNPNYLRAVNFLFDEQKEELIKLCKENESLPVEQDVPVKPLVHTERMDEFLSLYYKKISKHGLTLVGLYNLTDFSAMTERQVIGFYQGTKSNMDEMISIYEQLSQDEKDGIGEVDRKEFSSAVGVFREIGKIIEAIPAETLAEILSPAQNTSVEETRQDDEDEDYDDDLNEGEYDEVEGEDDGYDDDETEDDGYDEKFNDDHSQNLACIEEEINAAESELGKLGLFNGGKRKELKSKLKNLYLQKDILLTKRDIALYENKLNDLKNELAKTEQGLMDDINVLKGKISALPFTAISKKREFKDEMTAKKRTLEIQRNEYGSKITAASKTLNELTHKLKNLIKK